MLDSDLGRLGYPTDRMPGVSDLPAPADRPTTGHDGATHDRATEDRPTADRATEDRGADDSEHDEIRLGQEWEAARRLPTVDEIVPRSAAEVERWYPRITKATRSVIGDREFAGLRIELAVDVDPNRIGIAGDVVIPGVDVHPMVRKVGEVDLTLERDHSGRL